MRKVPHRRKALGLILMRIGNGAVRSAGDNEANGNGQDEEMRLQPEGTNKNA